MCPLGILPGLVIVADKHFRSDPVPECALSSAVQQGPEGTADSRPGQRPLGMVRQHMDGQTASLIARRMQPNCHRRAKWLRSSRLLSRGLQERSWVGIALSAECIVAAHRGQSQGREAVTTHRAGKRTCCPNDDQEIRRRWWLSPSIAERLSPQSSAEGQARSASRNPGRNPT